MCAYVSLFLSLSVCVWVVQTVKVREPAWESSEMRKLMIEHNRKLVFRVFSPLTTFDSEISLLVSV